MTDNDRRSDDRVYYDIDIGLEVGSKLYRIYNLSPSGFCMFVTDPNTFKVGDVISPIEMEFLEGGQVSVGKVKHVSPFPKVKNKKDVWIVGIKFLFPGDEDFLKNNIEAEDME